MSNDLVSQQFPMPGSQMVGLDAISDQLGSSLKAGLKASDPPMQQIEVSNTEMGLMGAGISGSEQMPTLNLQTGSLDAVSGYLGSQLLPIGSQQTSQMEIQQYSSISQPFLASHNSSGNMVNVLNNLGSQQLSVKRKAPMESMPNSPATQRILMPNKRMTQMEHRPWLQQPSAPNRRALPMQSSSSSPRAQYLPAPGKKTVRVDSTPNKSAQQTTQRNLPAQMQQNSKAQNETLESVRSKMRESLASALALDFQQQGEPSKVVKASRIESSSAPGMPEDISQGTEATSVGSGVVSHASEGTMQALTSSDECCAQKRMDDQLISQKSFHERKTGDGQDSQLSNVFQQEDVSFSDNIFAKDELLQGNGLSWVLDPDTDGGVKDGIQMGEIQKSENQMKGNEEEESGQSVQHLAFKIEVELFKFFGGVNKKYKEKGRSLLFNLKDRSNPELRERVMSGEITPERLCSMTAEELASKELSEWRQAKAEELAQMVVLPDTEVDFRRLVKKTHKGEFQVEVEQVDSGSMEVSVAASSVVRVQSKPKEAGPPPPAKSIVKKGVNVSNGKKNSADQETDCTITIPSTEGNDLMQGLIVDDDLKDAEFLPPIVSLDEFMESLHSEPPFEILPADTGKFTPISGKNDSEAGSESKSAVRTKQDIINAVLQNRDNTEARFRKSDVDLKPNGSDTKSETTLPVVLPKGDHVWEGLLQLSISTATSVMGIYKSGEKSPSKEWPGCLEVKGRVRLDAFEKFLQELPMSRSRAVMVMQLVEKEGSPKSESESESENCSLSEAANSYVMDGRVGFAEPTSGVELYLCPPHAKTLEMLGRILPKDQFEALNTLDNGLIGVVVWRRPQLTSTAVSPNSTSHPKHTSKKQHSTPRRHHEKDTTNMNVNYTSKPTAGLSAYNTQPSQDDDDDVPPGFGPAASRDEDDLPEFNFSGRHYSAETLSRGPASAPIRPHSKTPSLAVNQMRELIQKYGQPDANVPTGNWQNETCTGRAAIQPWNDDDDDDDIPEWQPQTQRQLPQPPNLVQNIGPPNLVQNIGGHIISQGHGIPAHQTMMRPPPQQIQQGAWRAPQTDVRFCQPNGGQHHGGVGWPKDAPKSRGF